MNLKIDKFLLEIENLFIIILISFLISDKIKLFLTSYFVCYLFIFFHELSHVFFASIFGEKVKKIKISIAGMCVTFNNNDDLNIIKRIIIYIAGPLSNMILAIIFYNIRFVFEINIFLAILNLMPIYPLDGYNILKIVFEYFKKDTFLEKFQFFFMLLLFLISIIVLLKTFNPSLVIFFVYIMLIKYVTKNHIK